MLKKLVVLAALFVALCFAGVGCFSSGVYVGLGDGIYYDGPYRNGKDLMYYYEGGLYLYRGGDYQFDHYVPQFLQGDYDKRYRQHHEQYHRDHPNSRNQHPGHSGYPPRVEEWKE